MKIISITQVKNESDIIESFIRYQLNIVDEMIILDNGSSDETVTIINKLIKEKLSITLIKDNNPYYTQDIKMTQLLYKAVKDFAADIILPLDVDEFIITTNGKNPRSLLESLNSDNYYLVKWITYIPTSTDDYNIKFIPQRITHIRDESFEEYFKVIIPKQMVTQFNAKISMGNHDLIIQTIDKKKLMKKESNLRLAHFPLRSKEQCISKICVGWPNIIAINTDNNPGVFTGKYYLINLQKITT